MDYNKTVDYIDSFIDFEKIPAYDYANSFRLERMHAFLEGLGNPHQGLRVIHEAGSKGKGSTCAIIASILRQAGYRVGLYTSPHLLDARERIRVLNRRSSFVVRDSEDFEGAIGKDEFIELIERIKGVAERFRDHETLGKLSFFEILTACAFLYFRERKVQFAILETGLGGRLDATNVSMAIACGITNISLEHTDKLGGSLESIAREKLGIVKVDSSQLRVDRVVISAPQEKEVMAVIREMCEEKKVSLYEIGKDINYSIIKSDEVSQIFNLEGPGYSYNNLEINLIGKHQVENAALGIAMIKSIDKSLIKIDEDALRVGLKDISWPGRLQIAQEDPYVILDGAQNVASIKAVLLSIKELFHYKRLICIFGISSDKDIEGVAKELDKVSDIVILTRSRSRRAKESIYLKENFSISSIKMSDNVEEALEMGIEIVDKRDLILVTGSLYVVGEAMAFFRERGAIRGAVRGSASNICT